MKKYIRAMFKGSAKTKLFLWTIVIVSLVAVVCMGACFLGAGLYYAYFAFGCMVFAVTYSQLAVFKDVNMEIEGKEQLRRSVANRKNGIDAEGNGGEGKKKKQQELEAIDLDNEYNKYTKDNLKKYFTTYKVKQENFKILIDSSDKYHIQKCPAYIWSDKKYVFLLVLEKKPRMITIDRREMASLRYEKGVVIKDIEEYKKVKESLFLSSLFIDLYPEYYKQMINGLTTFVKNLFVIGEDIRVTAPSVGGILKATRCRLELTDKQIDRKRFNGYFEEIYKANLLFKEKAITQDEYEEIIREHLAALAEHEEKIEVFQNAIYQMVQYQLISGEYAEFYMDYRGQLEAKKKRG